MMPMTDRERRAYNRGLEAAARAADLFSDENQRMAMDSVHSDPMLNRSMRDQIKTQAQLDDAMLKSESLEVDGCIHSSMSHAGKILAQMIRQEKGNADE